MNLMKTCLLVCVQILIAPYAHAFEYEAMLREKAFNKEQYHFFVAQFIDGRLNKEKPIGYIASFFDKPQSVGNDSLENDVNTVLKTHTESFDSSSKIIVVLNQLNLRYFKDYNMMAGKIEEIEITLSLDYYRVKGEQCELAYQQYFRSTTNVKFITSRAKAVDVSLSDAFAGAFAQFDRQLASYPAVAGGNLALSDMYGSVTGNKVAATRNTAITDGIYFNCKDVYLNHPSVMSNLITCDTVEATRGNMKLHSDKVVIDKAYAIVLSGRIYIYIKENLYKEAVFDKDGNLSFPDIIKSEIAPAAAGVGTALAISTFGILGAVVGGLSDHAMRNSSAERVKMEVYVDYETGSLTWKGQNSF